MAKKAKKPDKSIREVLRDWEGKEVLLTHAVFDRHVSAFHDEAHEYFETLKAYLATPESVVRSKGRKDTLIANIRLEQRRHNYLRVVIRYGSIWEKMLGKRNYIATFYGASEPLDGEPYVY